VTPATRRDAQKRPLSGRPPRPLRAHGRVPIGRHVNFTLPLIETASDALLVSRMMVEAVASGELSPVEDAEMSKTLETHIKLLEVVDLERRLAELEAQNTTDRNRAMARHSAGSLSHKRHSPVNDRGAHSVRPLSRNRARIEPH
jgi:hypothetical protein